MNRFPDFVSYIVRRLKILCPTLGKVKIAQILATTVPYRLLAMDQELTLYFSWCNGHRPHSPLGAA